MSINAMVDSKLAQDEVVAVAAAPAPEPPAPLAPGATSAPAAAAEAAPEPAHPKPVGVDAGIVSELMRWIPTETILIYVAVLSFFSPLTPKVGQNIWDLDFRGRWIAFLIMTLATPLVVLLLALAKTTKSDNLNFKAPIFAMIVSPLAFAVWASALPESPFLDFKGFTSLKGAAAATIATLVITLVANGTHNAPSTTTIVAEQSDG